MASDYLDKLAEFLISTRLEDLNNSTNQSQNPALSYDSDGGVSFKQRILGWLHMFIQP